MTRPHSDDTPEQLKSGVQTRGTMKQEDFLEFKEIRKEGDGEYIEHSGANNVFISNTNSGVGYKVLFRSPSCKRAFYAHPTTKGLILESRELNSFMDYTNYLAERDLTPKCYGVFEHKSVQGLILRKADWVDRLYEEQFEDRQEILQPHYDLLTYNQVRQTHQNWGFIDDQIVIVDLDMGDWVENWVLKDMDENINKFNLHRPSKEELTTILGMTMSDLV